MQTGSKKNPSSTMNVERFPVDIWTNLPNAGPHLQVSSFLLARASIGLLDSPHRNKECWVVVQISSAYSYSHRALLRILITNISFQTIAPIDIIVFHHLLQYDMHCAPNINYFRVRYEPSFVLPRPQEGRLCTLIQYIALCNSLLHLISLYLNTARISYLVRTTSGSLGALLATFPASTTASLHLNAIF